MDKELQSAYGLYNVRLDTKGAGYFTPCLRAGVEWRPREAGLRRAYGKLLE